MAAYFKLNNNEISKEHLLNKFNMISDNQGRLMLNDQKIPLSNEPQRSLGFVLKQYWRCSVKKGVLKKFVNFTEKHLCWSLFLIKLQVWACIFIKKRLQHWCFPVNFAKFLRTCILKNICERLLLFVSPQNTIANSSGVFALDGTLTEFKESIFFKHNNFIRSNAAISFIYKFKNVSL